MRLNRIALPLIACVVSTPGLVVARDMGLISPPMDRPLPPMHRNTIITMTGIRLRPSSARFNAMDSTTASKEPRRTLTITARPM